VTIEELKERAEGGKRAAERKALDATRLRDRANSLLAYEPFVDWLGDLMASVGFFGEGRELTPYQQGCRGRIVQEVERLCEQSDNGADFLARVFSEKILAKAKQGAEK
jgi:hypothetical protein